MAVAALVYFFSDGFFSSFLLLIAGSDGLMLEGVFYFSPCLPAGPVFAS